MAKKVRKKVISNYGNNIQLEYSEYLGENMWIDRNITLVPVTPISIFGEDLNFIWEGTYNGEKISVSLPRATPEELADITGLPNKAILYEQVISELKRILRQLN